MNIDTLRTLVSYTHGQWGRGFASAYFDISHDTEDAAKRVDLVWRDARKRLADQGAAAQTLDALDAAVAEAPPPVGQGGYGLIAANGDVMVAGELAEAPEPPITRWSELPYLVPFLAHAPPRMPNVVVRADQVGADITGVSGAGRIEHRVVTGSEKVHEPQPPSAPPRRHVREHARETVRRNLTQVAEVVSEVADQVDAELVVLSGETKGRTRLRDQLPDDVRELVAESSPGDADAIVAEVAKTRQREHTASLIAELTAGLSRADGLACLGLADTCAALREANVRTLLIGDSGETTVLTGPEPTEIGADEAQVGDVPRSALRQHRADEALPFAALASAADLAYVGPETGLADGFGALLRHR